ncbi:MAG: FAD-dependent oxidoreductase [Chloroflexi bacterium]|nr:FAD-dependent oxidoreductase [Chloroflexota bacterium]
MARVVVVGAGVGGLSAAITAAQAGVETILIERNDFLSGLCVWSGHHGGGYAIEETQLMGGGSLRFHDALKKYATYWQHELSDWKEGVWEGDEAFAYDVLKSDEAAWEALSGARVKVMLRSQMVDVAMKGNRLEAVVLSNGTRVAGDAFVDATGRAGFRAWCEGWGQGCGMCILKCPIYGDCTSVSTKAGVADVRPQGGHRQAGGPRFFQATMVLQDSVAPWLLEACMEAKARYFYHVPQEFLNMDLSREWLHPDRPLPAEAGFYEGPEFLINYCPWMKVHANVPAHILRRMPGFEDAFFVTPLTGDANTVFIKRSAPTDDTLRVDGLANLFAAGERARTVSSMGTCMPLGDLAGHNAARVALGREPVALPTSTILGYFINVIRIGNPPAGGPRFTGPKGESPPVWREKGFISDDSGKDIKRIRQEVEKANLVGIYQQRLA